MKRFAVAVFLASWCTVALGSSALRPAVTTQGSYGESFTFIADLDDGAYVQLSLGFTNLGPGSVKALCRAVVAPPGAPMWHASTRVGRDGWKWSDGDAERLSISSCAATVEGDTTRVEVPLEGGVVRLRLAGAAVRRIPADAAFGADDRYYRTEIMLYRVRVDGSIQLPGQSQRPVAGWGYLDHTRSTIKPRDLADRWVRFRALRADRGLLVLARRSLDGRFTPVWACDPPGRCRYFSAFTLDRSGEARAPSFRITFPSERHPLRIDSGRLLYRDDPIEHLGVLGKIVSPFVGAPITYVYRAQVYDGQAPPLEGILEVELSSE